MLNRFWAYSLLKRMNFVKQKVMTARSKHVVAGGIPTSEGGILAG